MRVYILGIILLQTLDKSHHLSHRGDGNNLDHWYSGDRSEGTLCPCLHLHYLCRLPRSLHLCHLRPALKAGERELCQMVEGESC